jgi:hypothetical protein
MTTDENSTPDRCIKTLEDPAMASTAYPELDTLLRLGCKMIRLAPRDKRPTMGGWQNWGTDDINLVEGWINRGLNVGLLLGPESGVIDVETDSAEGELLARHFLLDHIDGAGFTPTWRSARGIHRLYRWEPWMPTTAKIDLGGLEVRIGGRAAQSVLPPSIHPSGAAYRWEIRPFISTDEICVQEVPESLREAILEGAALAGGR